MSKNGSGRDNSGGSCGGFGASETGEEDCGRLC